MNANGETRPEGIDRRLNERRIPLAVAQFAVQEHARLVERVRVLEAALYAIATGFSDGSIKWAKPRRADNDPYHPANVLMCAALADAEMDAEEPV